MIDPQNVPIENGGALEFFPPGYNVIKGEALNAIVLALLSFQKQVVVDNGATAAEIALNITGPDTEDNFQSALAVPVDAALTGYNGFASYVRNDRADGGGTFANGVCFYGVGVANADNCSVYGANYGMNDNPNSHAVSTGTGINLLGIEFDMTATSVDTNIQGIGFLGSCLVQPAGATACLVGELSSQAPGTAQWTAGYVVGDGAIKAGGPAYVIGVSGKAGTGPSTSQIVAFNYRDSASNPQNLLLTVADDGFLSVTGSVGTEGIVTPQLIVTKGAGLNGPVLMPSIPSYPNDAAAHAAGVQTHQLYFNTTVGAVDVCFL